MKKLIIEIAIVIVLTTILGILWDSNVQMRKDLKRWDSNWTNLVKQQLKQNSVITLHQDEFKVSMNEYIDSIMKVAKIKPKQVTEVTNITNYYIDSSKTIIRPEPVVSKDTIYPFIDIKDCFTIGGFMKVIRDRPELIINKREFDNEITLLGYWKRPHKFLFIQWGKRENYIESPAKCGKTIVQKVEIIKK